MGRAKRKRKAKEKAKRKAKIKAGKLVRFVLSNSPVKYNGWSNRYNYQSFSYRCSKQSHYQFFIY